MFLAKKILPYKKGILWGLIGLSPFLLSACDDTASKVQEEEPPMPAEFTITLINATANQPFSPPAVLLHGSDYSPWEVGSPASLGLEELAESGSPSAFLSEENTMAWDSAAGTDIVMPGATTSLSLSADEMDGVSLSVATMLVNTNDAFTGIATWDISALAVGESAEVLAPVYDAGTEMNTETAVTVPGPAGGGEGFNMIRDDVGFVAMHGGVITMDDGLMASALDQSHRFDNGALLIRVSRVK